MVHRFNFCRAVNILTRIEVGAAGRVFQHWDADVLEVLSPLCEALTLQTASPENQLTLEQALHQIQAVCVGGENTQKTGWLIHPNNTTKNLLLKFYISLSTIPK